MKYYQFSPSLSSKYYSFDLKGGGARHLDFFSERLRKQEPIEDWPELEIELQVVKDDEVDLDEGIGGSEVVPDVGICYGEPIYSERFKEALGEVFSFYGQFLPVIFGGSKYYFFHVTNYIFALNKEKSEFSCFSDGSIMSMMRVVLRKNVLNERAILFRLHEDPMEIFMSEDIRKIIDAAGLYGACFKEIEVA